MNSKTAKILRRKAREITIGKPLILYLVYQGSRRIRNMYQVQKNKNYQLKVDPSCTRGVYLKLKKNYSSCPNPRT